MFNDRRSFIKCRISCQSGAFLATAKQDGKKTQKHIRIKKTQKEKKICKNLRQKIQSNRLDYQFREKENFKLGYKFR